MGSRRPALVLLSALFLVLPGPSPLPARAQEAGCTFVLGFQQLRNQIPDLVGQCLENEHEDPRSGDIVQATTGGLLVYSVRDGVVRFTDGHLSWVAGPCGLQWRPNTQRFAWELGGSCDQGEPRPAASPTAARPAERRPGAVRTLPAGLADQRACHALGGEDAEQDRRAGVRLQSTRPSGEVTAIFKTDFDVVYWDGGEGQVVEVRWNLDGGRPALLCALAYLDGYRGEAFRERP